MECNFDDWFIWEDNIKIDLKETELEGVWNFIMSTILTFGVI
jgi:hypothetical protein